MAINKLVMLCKSIKCYLVMLLNVANWVIVVFLHIELIFRQILLNLG